MIGWLWPRATGTPTRGQDGSPPLRIFEERATLAATIADRALEPRKPFANGPADAAACELYRQAIFWALLGRREFENRGRFESVPTGVSAEPPEGGAPSESAVPSESAMVGHGSAVVVPAVSLRDLWENTDWRLKASLSSSAADTDRIGELISELDYRDFAELDAFQQSQLAWKLRTVTRALLGAIDPGASQLRLARLRRMARLVGVMVLLAVIALVILRVVDTIRWRNDYARTASWVASSKYPEYGCPSPGQDCEGKGPYFFATAEEDSPWLVMDLGAVEQFSRVQVKNREDCCFERATPLILEVSVDKKTWKEVARRKEVFKTWNVQLEPTSARWLRFRVEKTTNLHFSRVRVAP